jgi:hypothetical protein
MEPEQSRSWFDFIYHDVMVHKSGKSSYHNDIRRAKTTIASVPAGRPAEGGCDQRLGRGNERDGRALAEPAAYSRSSINRVGSPVLPDATEPVLVR